MAYSKKRAPKMSGPSFMDSARDGSGLSRGQKKNNSLMSKVRSENSKFSSDAAAAKKATTRARKAAAAGGKGAKHRPAGSARGGQFY